MDVNFITMPSILVICYLVGMIIKASRVDSHFIPIICGVTGAILGVIAFFVIPDMIGHDPFSAVAIGIVSGLAATGTHQVGKQLQEYSHIHAEDHDDYN
jgi:uncharacterized membrane protein YuzA (DUF378 family)